MAGVAVFGAGAGSWVWTLVARALMNPAGAALSPGDVMSYFAILFAILLLTILPFLRNPPPGYTSPLPKADSLLVRAQTMLSCSKIQSSASASSASSASPDRIYTFLNALSTREMALTAVVIFSTSLPGVVFLSSASDMVSNVFLLDAQTANLVTSWLNLVNFCGRAVWGAVTDIIGRKSFFILSSSLQAIALLIMSSAVQTGSYGTWLVCFLTIGSLYGGGFGVLPAFCAEMWGSKISSATHGALITTWATACIVGAPIFASVNYYYAHVGSDGIRIPSREGYAINAIWLSTLPMLSAITLLFLDVRREDRRTARAKSSLRIRIFTWVISLSRVDGIKFLDPQAQEEEYKSCGARDDLSCPIASDAGNIKTEKSSSISEKELELAISEWGATGSVHQSHDSTETKTNIN
jgi:hypothetical protein